MAEQLHKKFLTEAVKERLEKYLNKEVEAKYIIETLGIKRRRFFELLQKYKKNPDAFSIKYIRKKANYKIDKKIEKNIIKELETEQRHIKNEAIPIESYNYTYVKDQLAYKHNQKVSLPTIIKRAKKYGFYFPRPKRKAHDREVLTNYAGELLQHDSSQHLWSPYANEKWYLITTIDDYSRFMLYAKLVKRESSWEHILALENVFLKYGLPFRYYVDSHSIFRFVQGRDSVWRDHRKVTDEVDTQWEQVLTDCNVKLTHALSAQAKGKVERPYQWLQDRLVRTCAREDVRYIEQAIPVLKDEVERYNYHQVHSTTKEIPVIRFERALKAKRSLFREFSISPPFQSTKDIFCIRDDRTVNGYHRISINNLKLTAAQLPLYEKVQLRISPDEKTGLAEIRFWHENKLLGIQRVKKSDLNLVHF